jgi:3-isopropylmalate dehydratase small subunit
MQPFVQHTGIAAPLLREHVDTDLIIPKQFLKTLSREGLGRHLFHDLRFDDGGRERPEFVLNRPPYRQASILLGGGNFGCGSSREHAPWALLDFGIRCVLAPSFADIFFNNCLQNGLLPACAGREALAELAASGEPVTVDLPSQTVRQGDRTYPFAFPAHRKEALLKGLDAIGETEQALEAVRRFEAGREGPAPWLNRAPLERLQL